MREVLRAEPQRGDGRVGRITDALVNIPNWAVRKLIIDDSAVKNSFPSSLPVAQLGAPARGSSSGLEQESPSAVDDLDHDFNLKSLRALIGYAAHAADADGEFGYVEDFVLDDTNWTVPLIIMHTGRRLRATRLLVSTTTVHEIDGPHKIIDLRLPIATIRSMPEFNGRLA
jgi:hypothetical protein